MEVLNIILIMENLVEDHQLPSSIEAASFIRLFSQANMSEKLLFKEDIFLNILITDAQRATCMCITNDLWMSEQSHKNIIHGMAEMTDMLKNCGPASKQASIQRNLLAIKSL